MCIGDGTRSPINPATTIVAFDIHGVLFKPDYKKIAILIWKNKWSLGILRFLFHPTLLYVLCRFLLKKAPAEEYIDFARKKPGLRKYLPLAIEMANAHVPIESTVKVAQELKFRGYELHIFSNIGPTLLDDLAAKYPNIFRLFDKSHVPSAEMAYLCKPCKEAFNHYIATYNPKNKQIIFIDDNPHNVRSADETGLVGIFYDKTALLYKRLERLGAL